MVLRSGGLRSPWGEPITQTSRLSDLKNGKVKMRRKNGPGRKTTLAVAWRLGAGSRQWKYGWELSRGMWKDEAGELSQSRSRENSKGSSKKCRAI